jgi:hypothetical protein
VDDSIVDAERTACEFKRQLIIDYNLRVPNTSLINQSAFKISVIDDLNSKDLSPAPDVIYTFNREFVEPEATYLDLSWRSLIHNLASTFDLILILPPLEARGKELHDSYLAALSSWQF